MAIYFRNLIIGDKFVRVESPAIWIKIATFSLNACNNSKTKLPNGIWQYDRFVDGEIVSKVTNMATQSWRCDKCGEQYAHKDKAEECERKHTEQLCCFHKHAFFSIVIICTNCNESGTEKPEKCVPITDPYLRKIFGDNDASPKMEM